MAITKVRMADKMIDFQVHESIRQAGKMDDMHVLVRGGTVTERSHDKPSRETTVLARLKM